VRNELLDNAGYAGDAFARYIVKPEVREMIKRSLDGKVKELWEKTGLEPQYRFWIRAAACIAVAGVLVRELGLVEFSPDRIMDWLIAQMMKAGGGKTQRRVDRIDSAAEALAKFINEETGNFLILPQPWKQGMGIISLAAEVKSKLSGLFTVSDQVLTVPIDLLKRYALKYELPRREWFGTLTEHNVMAGPFQRKLTAGTNKPGAVQWCYVINLLHPAMAGASVSTPPQADQTNVTLLHRRPASLPVPLQPDHT
jgi:hypothetical protein